MKQVEVNEFKERSIDYLTGSEPLSIEHNGEVVGFYYPKKRKKQQEVDLAFERFNRAVEQFLAETDMTQDELADLLDLSKPFPYDACLALSQFI